MAKMCKGTMTKTGNFAFNAHPSLWGGVEQTEGVLTPPLHQLSHKKEQKPHQHHQRVLQHFLVTLPAIRRIFAPDINCAHPRESIGTPWGVSCC